MLEQVQIEEEAERLYREARFRWDEPIAPATLARAAMGPGSVRLVPPEAMRHSAAVARIGDVWRIYIRSDLTERERNFSIAHELAEWLIARRGLGDADTEQSADAMAAAILVPKPFALKACGVRGAKWSQLARDFRASESCAALRYGEVTGEPLVLLTPRCARERGQPYPWPPNECLKKPGKIPGIRKACLRDDPRRVVALPG